MAAVSETHEEQFGIVSGDDPADGQVALGAVMVTTILAVAVGGYVLGPPAAASAAVAMLPLLILASLRTSLDNHSAYAALAQRR